MGKIIGLVGEAGSGKDTIGRFFIEKLRLKDKTALRFAFGDNLKKVASIITGVPLDFFHNQDKKENHLITFNNRTITLRVLLQELGTDIIRDYFGPDVWANSMAGSFYFSTCEHPIVTDVRFKNEAKFIKDQGGVLIKINNPYLKNKSNHQSETELNNIEVDYEILNNYKEDPDGVNRATEFILEEILNGK